MLGDVCVRSLLPHLSVRSLLTHLSNQSTAVRCVLGDLIVDLPTPALISLKGPTMTTISISITQNKRIYANFMRHDMMIGCLTEQAQTILNRVWAKFGTASNIHYPESWSYCFLSFGSHAAAEAAIDGLNDPERFATYVKQVLQQVKAQLALEIALAPTEANRQKAITFVTVALLLLKIRATWADP
jgi:hypothetical protein